MNAPALLAAAGASAGVWMHGVVGQRWFVAQLHSIELQPTRPWGDADVTRRVFAVVWHIVTAAFAASAVALYVTAFEAVDSRALLRFISASYAAFVGVGLVFLGTRPKTLAQPFAAAVVTSLVVVSVFAWIAQPDT